MATEKRLIDANEIEELFYKQVEYGATDLVDAFDDALQDAQTVDAVEVDRCKDCIRYNTDGCANGFGWCEAYDNGRMDNDFCSFGAKMDGDENV